MCEFIQDYALVNRKKLIYLKVMMLRMEKHLIIKTFYQNILIEFSRAKQISKSL